MARYVRPSSVSKKALNYIAANARLRMKLKHPEEKIFSLENGIDSEDMNLLQKKLKDSDEKIRLLDEKLIFLEKEFGGKFMDIDHEVSVRVSKSSEDLLLSFMDQIGPSMAEWKSKFQMVSEKIVSMETEFDGKFMGLSEKNFSLDHEVSVRISKSNEDMLLSVMKLIGPSMNEWKSQLQMVSEKMKNLDDKTLRLERIVLGSEKPIDLKELFMEMHESLLGEELQGFGARIDEILHDYLGPKVADHKGKIKKEKESAG